MFEERAAGLRLIKTRFKANLSKQLSSMSSARSYNIINDAILRARARGNDASFSLLARSVQRISIALDNLILSIYEAVGYRSDLYPSAYES